MLDHLELILSKKSNISIFSICEAFVWLEELVDELAGFFKWSF